MSFLRFKPGEPVVVRIRCAVGGECSPNVHNNRAVFLSKKGMEGRVQIRIDDPMPCISETPVIWYVPRGDVSKLDAVTRLGDLA